MELEVDVDLELEDVDVEDEIEVEVEVDEGVVLEELVVDSKPSVWRRLSRGLPREEDEEVGVVVKRLRVWVVLAAVDVGRALPLASLLPLEPRVAVVVVAVSVSVSSSPESPNPPKPPMAGALLLRPEPSA